METTYQTVKYRHITLELYWSGNYWYCRNIKEHTQKCGSGKTIHNAVSDFSELNNI